MGVAARLGEGSIWPGARFGYSRTVLLESPQNMSKRSKSSHRWLTRQRRDAFSRRAADEGQISRAHFKLEQLDAKFRLLRSGMKVLELGAAPGGWTRYIEDRIHGGIHGGIEGGLLIVCDSRPVSAGSETVVIDTPYGEEAADLQLKALLHGPELDLVLSDMAPNMSGNRATDQARAMYLADLAVEAALRWLKPKGDLVVKMFQGQGVDEWVADLRRRFATVQLVKPKASRPESREVYAVAREFRGSD